MIPGGTKIVIKSNVCYKSTDALQYSVAVPAKLRLNFYKIIPKPNRKNM